MATLQDILSGNFPAAQRYAEGYAQMPSYLQDPYLGLSTSQVGNVTKGLLSKTQFEKAQEIASKNAETLLGLPKGNTAMDRAKAMGFDTENPVYHGTGADIKKFSNRMSNRGYGTSLAEDAKNAEGYAQNGAIYPLLINKNKVLDVTNPNQVEQLSKVTDEYFANYKPYTNQDTFYPFTKTAIFEGFQKPHSAFYAEQRLVPQLVKKAGYEGTKALEDNMAQYKIYDPKNIRSQFAAFDPARMNENDILAGVMAIPISGLLQEPKEKKKKK